jgi:hypothetical protein
MQQLLGYSTVIYDANCIVYQSFSVMEHDTTGVSVHVSSPDTARARRITNSLVYNKKTVSTVRRAFEEADKILVGKALTQLIENGTIQQQLKIKGKLDPMLKLRIAKNLRGELERMKRQSWFVISLFVADQKRTEQVKELYRVFCLDPELSKRIPGGKGDPSDVDISLLLFSADCKHPLLTNDRELYKFSDELREKGFCELIRGFPDIKF